MRLGSEERDETGNLIGAIVRIRPVTPIYNSDDHFLFKKGASFSPESGEDTKGEVVMFRVHGTGREGSTMCRSTPRTYWSPQDPCLVWIHRVCAPPVRL